MVSAASKTGVWRVIRDHHTENGTTLHLVLSPLSPPFVGLRRYFSGDAAQTRYVTVATAIMVRVASQLMRAFTEYCAGLH